MNYPDVSRPFMSERAALRRAVHRSAAIAGLCMLSVLPVSDVDIPGTPLSLSLLHAGWAQPVELSALDNLTRGNELLLRGSYLGDRE